MNLFADEIAVESGDPNMGASSKKLYGERTI
jgi:hypothetical protein